MSAEARHVHAGSVRPERDRTARELDALRDRADRIIRRLADLYRQLDDLKHQIRVHERDHRYGETCHTDTFGSHRSARAGPESQAPRSLGFQGHPAARPHGSDGHPGHGSAGSSAPGRNPRPTF